MGLGGFAYLLPRFAYLLPRLLRQLLDAVPCFQTEVVQLVVIVVPRIDGIVVESSWAV